MIATSSSELSLGLGTPLLNLFIRRTLTSLVVCLHIVGRKNWLYFRTNSLIETDLS